MESYRKVRKYIKQAGAELCQAQEVVVEVGVEFGVEAEAEAPPGQNGVRTISFMTLVISLPL